MSRCFGMMNFLQTRAWVFLGAADFLGLCGQVVRRADLTALKLRCPSLLKLGKTNRKVGRETDSYINPRQEHLAPY